MVLSTKIDPDCFQMFRAISGTNTWYEFVGLSVKIFLCGSLQYHVHSGNQFEVQGRFRGKFCCVLTNLFFNFSSCFIHKSVQPSVSRLRIFVFSLIFIPPESLADTMVVNRCGFRIQPRVLRVEFFIEN